MRSTLATPAIILRSRPYGESDKIVCLLTENYGKLTGIAKGAKRSRKRFANSLELFSMVNLRFQDRPHGSLVFLLSADLSLTFKRLGTSLEKIAIASYLVEIIDGLFGERDENPLIFRHLKKGLLFLDSHDSAPLEFLTSFEMRLLGLAGYRPALNGCKGCARLRKEATVTRWYFSLPDGGLFCTVCGQTRKGILPLSVAALTALSRLEQDKHEERFEEAGLGTLPMGVLMEIRFIMQRFLEFHMEREIRSAAFLSKFVAA
jgi:DNA repair protein RecO (recombination protein O)